MKPKSEFRTG